MIIKRILRAIGLAPYDHFYEASSSRSGAGLSGWQLTYAARWESAPASALAMRYHLQQTYRRHSTRVTK